MQSLTPSSHSHEWLDTASELVAALEDFGREVLLASTDPDQQVALALVAWDLGQFAGGAVELARAGNWSPAHAMGRLIQERAEHLVALRHDPDFATRFMDRSRAIGKDGQSPRRREGEARGIFRRSVALPTDDDGTHLLESLIALSDWGSVPVHATIAAPALAWGAADDPSGDDALFIAVHIAGMGIFALWAMVLVVEATIPGSQVTDAAWDVLAKAAERVTEATARWRS